jgi:cystathionine beta-synthase
MARQYAEVGVASRRAVDLAPSRIWHAVQYVETILDLVGDTPLVRLHRITEGLRPTVLAKLEHLNPGGSVKDRIGLAMIEDAERRGLIHAGGTIVEPTSGNTGHGLAMAASLKGYKMVFVMPDKMSAEKISLLRAYGAEVVVCPTNVERDSPLSYYSVADRLTREIPGAFQPNQYFNPRNPEAHYRTTGPEIWQQTDGRVNAFVTGVGTGGTISGVGRYLKEQNPSVRVIGADPEGSIYSGPIAPYKVEGVGEDFWPGTFDRAVVDEIIQVTDRDAFVAARRLAREEGILVGGSAGLALHAAIQVAVRSGPDDVIVVLLADTGRNYLSKFFSDEWMRQNGYLQRLVPARVREVVTTAHSDGVPTLVSVAAGKSVGEAIDLMQQYGISQLPVVEDANGGAAAVVGSIQERSLLDRVYRDPAVVSTPVSTAMDPPFARVSAAAPIEEAFEALLGGESALMICEGEQPVGVITRSDLLEFVAHQGRT